MVGPSPSAAGARLLLNRGISRTCARQVCASSRPANRHEANEPSLEFKGKVLELDRANPRFGFRRVHAHLSGVNLSAVHRIWREEGLVIRHRTRRKLKVPKTEGPLLTAAGQARCLGFCHERLENGRRTRTLGIQDCYARECLLLKAASTFPSTAVEKELQWMFLVHGKPEAIVSENGPEFRAMTLPEGVEECFIQLGGPWQNGNIESFFGRLGDELRSCELFARGTQVRAVLDDFPDHYNNGRPRLGLGGLTSAGFGNGLHAAGETDALTL